MKTTTVLVSIFLFAMAIGCSNPTGYYDPMDKYLIGDINLNKLSYEIADAVLLSNYLVFGDSVLIKDRAIQTLNSDVNMDNEYLSVSDLVSLIRVVVGDADPYIKTKNREADTPKGLLKFDSQYFLSTTKELGAIQLIFNGEVNPILFLDGLNLQYHFDGKKTRVLIFSYDPVAFYGVFLRAEGVLLSVDASTPDGEKIDLTIIE